jgi:hypothetical protein
MVIIKSWKDLEFEIGFLEKNNHSSKNNLSVGQILDCLSTEIESSMSYTVEESQSFLKNWFSQFRLKKFEKENSWTPKWKFPELPKQHEEIDELGALLRLKTAITAFRLHSGPFSHHPLFGKLEKVNWETIHLKVATYLMACIEMENREKIKKFNPNHKKQKYYNNKNKKPKGSKSR